MPQLAAPLVIDANQKTLVWDKGPGGGGHPGGVAQILRHWYASDALTAMDRDPTRYFPAVGATLSSSPRFDQTFCQTPFYDAEF